MPEHDLPLYLILPLLSSIIFAIGLVLVKQANQLGVRPATVTLTTNAVTALVFSPLWLLGGNLQPWNLWWQPAVVAGLYLFGQIFTFIALERGDVSIAAPLFSTKVLLVVILLTVVDDTQIPLRLWVAALLATTGIAIIQRSQANASPRRVLFTIFFALLAAGTYALFDVVVQVWARNWGAGRLLPIGFWMSGLLTLIAWPWLDRSALARREVRNPLLWGCFLFGIQSVGIATSLGVFGDATRINIVYSLRGVWSVALAWILSQWIPTAESRYTPSVMAMRFAGAALVTVGLILAITTRLPR